MIRFSAKYSALIDDKGRVVFPSAYKKALGNMADELLVVEKDIYKTCLNIYPQRYWNQHLESIERQLNPFNEADDDLLAGIYENFTTVAIAPNGRINIPDEFLSYAGISRDVVFLGKGKSIRVWDEKQYNENKASQRPLKDIFKDRLGGAGNNE